MLNTAIVKEREPFFASWSDPTYDYLFNGLNIATGHLQVGHAPHPGTPLHIYTGILIRTFHFFRSEENIINDVITNPEWYLFRIAITNCLLIFLCMFYAGVLMLRFSQSIFYALIIQLTHVISLRALFFSQNLMTEFILVLTGILLAPLLFIYTFSENKKSFSKLLLTAGIITGVMIAGKLSSFSILILWLIIISNWKNRIYFSLTTAATFLILTIPAWNITGEFLGWISSMVTHTGRYGAGEEGFANWPEFFKNLLFAFNDVWIFTAMFIVITIIMIRSLIKTILYKPVSSGNQLQTLFGFWIAITIQIFIVCKHFSPHYMIPVHLLVVPAGLLLLNGNFKSINERLLKNSLFNTILPLTIAVLLLSKAAVDYHFYPGLRQPAKDIIDETKSWEFEATILDCNITSPFPQPALFYGVNYTAGRAELYKKTLKQVYPGFYLIDKSKKALKGWENEFEPKQVLKDGMKILYYTNDVTFNIQNLQWENGVISIETVYKSYTPPHSKESVHLVKIKMNEQNHISESPMF